MWDEYEPRKTLAGITTKIMMTITLGEMHKPKQASKTVELLPLLRKDITLSAVNFHLSL